MTIPQENFAQKAEESTKITISWKEANKIVGELRAVIADNPTTPPHLITEATRTHIEAAVAAIYDAAEHYKPTVEAK